MLNLCFYFLSDVHSQLYARLVDCDIEKCLIERDGLNKVSVLMKYLMHLSRHFLVHLITPRHYNELRAQTLSNTH